VFIELRSNGRYADRIENNSAGKFIGALPVAQQRSINTGTSLVAYVMTCLLSRCLAMLWPSTLQYYNGFDQRVARQQLCKDGPTRKQ
jgi:hypothetical protein